MRKLVRMATAASVLAALLGAVPGGSASAGGGAVRVYRVTIRNLTDGQPLTPPVVATHRGMVRLFEVGEEASFELKEIAENGNDTPMLSMLSSDAKVYASLETTTGSLVPSGLPGSAMFDDRVTFRIRAGEDVRWISFVQMLICTNDGITGRRTLLPDEVGERKVRHALAYDAGTEDNTEDFADIVPPCQGLSGVSSSDPGTGTSNPALAEGGVIHHHDGIVGGADLVPAVHDWHTNRPVVRIVITRVA